MCGAAMGLATNVRVAAMPDCLGGRLLGRGQKRIEQRQPGRVCSQGTVVLLGPMNALCALNRQARAAGNRTQVGRSLFGLC